MSKRSTTPTRISADIAGRAAAVASVEQRTTAEQINYWARIGMRLERDVAVNHRRILAVVRGSGQFTDLDQDERAIAHALIDANISRRVASERFGAAGRSSGEVTVSIDDDGQLIEIGTDGATRQL